MKNSEVYNILYVDDEYQNLISFKACFRKFYNVIIANSAREAIEILKNEEIHLIITDQRMPEMTGVEFLEEVLKNYPDTIRMILTGFSDMDSIITAINTGRVFRYVTKPWDENELKMTIDTALNLYKLQLENKELLSDLQNKVKEQNQLLELFQKFVPSEVVEKALLQHQSQSLFEGEYRKVAVLFCDIRQFTTISEQISPREVVSFLNDYYQLFSSVIKKHSGHVIQYVGDEIFASFGAPSDLEDIEIHAVKCALDMKEALSTLNLKYHQQLNRKIDIGIGVNSGPVVAGNLGSDDKLSYSITGDTVNTGKRIETLSKDRPDVILISESVFEKVREMIDYVPWEPAEVKGKSGRIVVYEVIGKK